MKDNTLSWMSGDGVNRSTNRFAGNQHTKTNSDAMINKGRGPTGGGTSMPSCGHEMVKGSSHPQKRQAVGDGQTTSMPSRGKESFNYGRGPTKGNE